jgi:hypothetical protein
MRTITTCTLEHTALAQEEDLLKGIYLVVIYASRIPPHIGMIAGKKYHSLTIKGHEINLSPAVLLKNIKIRKTPSLFIRIRPHSTFSSDYLSELFISNVQQFSKVESKGPTCLSPVKLFFEEAYDLPLTQVNYLFELVPELFNKNLIEAAFSLNLEPGRFVLPVYSMDKIYEEINKANKEAQLIRKIKIVPGSNTLS